MAVGVSHLTVPSDVEGVMAVCDWLAYVPRCRHSPLPVLPFTDPVNRPIKFTPTKVPYDPRYMLAGRLIRSMSTPLLLQRECHFHNSVFFANFLVCFRF